MWKEEVEEEGEGRELMSGEKRKGWGRMGRTRRGKGEEGGWGMGEEERGLGYVGERGRVGERSGRLYIRTTSSKDRKQTEER